MPFQLSPGVNVSEIDLTTIVPSVGTTEGAYAGRFAWGPINKIVTISNEIELVSTFGKPDSSTYLDYFTCANFLSYARNLKVIRAANTSVAKNATANGNGLLIANRDQYEVDYMDLSAANTNGMFAAKYAGELGNSLSVSLWASANATAFASWGPDGDYASEFNGAPGTSQFVAGVNGANDEMHILVIDSKGAFTGLANTILEKFSYVSKASDAKNDDGSSNYWVNVLNSRSSYIYAINNAMAANGVAQTTTWGTTAGNTTFDQTSNEYTFSLSGGVSGTVSDANRTSAYDLFDNADEVDVSLVVLGSASSTLIQNVIDRVVTNRKDCVAFFSPRFDDVVNNVGDEAADIIAFKNLIGRSTSYAVMDSGWKYQFDKFNNVYRWIPLNGDIAGLCVRTDFERDPWFSPAGFNRGQIKNVVKVAWNPNKTMRDELYKNGINPVVTFNGEGTILYGDKTLLAKPSAFDRINVRRLFIVLEKAIARAAKYSLFEFNDAFTRAQFVALVEPYLRDVQGRRGIYDFRVVCDETNNTPEVIDRNEFIGDIYIKPARSINFIQLNFVAVRTGVAFDEIVGRF
jgi:phage tail sheath protein FI